MAFTMSPFWFPKTAVSLFCSIPLMFGGRLMNTLVEIVAAVRRLSPSQLAELRQEVERLEKDSRAIRFDAHE
jgi:hypothetical protein